MESNLYITVPLYGLVVLVFTHLIYFAVTWGRVTQTIKDLANDRDDHEDRIRIIEGRQPQTRRARA